MGVDDRASDFLWCLDQRERNYAAGHDSHNHPTDLLKAQNENLLRDTSRNTLGRDGLRVPKSDLAAQAGYWQSACLVRGLEHGEIEHVYLFENVVVMLRTKSRQKRVQGRDANAS